MSNDPGKAHPPQVPGLRSTAHACLAWVLAIGSSAGWAQQNAGNVFPAVDPALADLCTTTNGTSAACALTGSQARATLAPDKLVTFSRTALVATQAQTDVLQGRLSDLRGANATGSFGPGSGAPSGSKVVSVPPSSNGNQPSGTDDSGSGGPIATKGIGFFVRAEGGRDTSDSTNYDPGFKQRSTTMTVGADFRPHPDWVLGAAFGSRSSRSGIDTSDGASFANVSERGSSFSLYGSYYPVPNAYLDAVAVIGRGRYNSRRDIYIPATNTSDAAVGETTSKEQSLSIGGGYALANAQWNYGPYGRVSYSHVKVDAFAERANPTASNLSVAAQGTNSLVSGLGGQVSYAQSMSWGVLVPSLRLEWNHQFRNDKTKNIVATFVEAGASAVPMNIATTPVDRNYATIDLGLAAAFGIGRSGVLNYSTVVGRSGQSSHVVTAEVRLEF